MKTSVLKLILFSFLLALVSCKTTNQSSNSQNPNTNFLDFGEPIQIRLGEQFYFEDKLEFTFQSVQSDSRCPKGVKCVWQGNAEIILKITNPEKNTSEFVNLQIEGYKDRNNSNHQKIIANGYNFTLLELNPYPQANQDKNFMSYEALILIEKL